MLRFGPRFFKVLCRPLITARRSVASLALDVQPSFTAIQLPGTNKPSRFHHVWLRDNCKCSACKEPSSQQRMVDIPTAEQTVLKHAVSNADSVEFQWADGHVSQFDASWLQLHDYDAARRQAVNQQQQPVLWDTVNMKALPEVDFETALADEHTHWTLMRHLANVGVCVLNNVPKTGGQVDRLANHIAYIQETLYGRTFDVKVVPNPHNAAYAPVPLPLHMDLCYYEAPPGLQLLHFIQTDCRGGANEFGLAAAPYSSLTGDVRTNAVDMFAAVEALRTSNRAAFDVLSTVKFSFHFRDNENWMYYRRPLINVDAQSGTVSQVFWSPPWQAPLAAEFDDVEAAYEACRALAKIVNDPTRAITKRFEAGQMVIFNNRRIAHSRLPFEASDGIRHAQGTYVLGDEFCSKFRILQRRHAASAANDDGLLMPRQGFANCK